MNKPGEEKSSTIGSYFILYITIESLRANFMVMRLSRDCYDPLLGTQASQLFPTNPLIPFPSYESKSRTILALYVGH